MQINVSVDFFCLHLASVVLTYFYVSIAANKAITRFWYRGLQNEDKLAQMFEDFRSTSDDYWCASSGLAPTKSSLINADDYDNK